MARFLLKCSAFDGYDADDDPVWKPCVFDVEDFRFVSETYLRGGQVATHVLFYDDIPPLIVGGTLDEFLAAVQKLTSQHKGDVHA